MIADPIRLGIVGLGKIARDQHLPSILKNPRFQLEFVVDREIRVDAGVPSFTSLSDFLTHDIAFDAISICTSPQVRFELCEMLFDHCAAILLEKPAAAKYSQALQIFDRAKSSEICLFATWHSRFAPQVAMAKRWVQANGIYKGKIEWRENAQKWHPGQDWIWREGGFGVFDPGMNALSILTEISPGDWSVGDAIIGVPGNAQTPSFAEFELQLGDASVHSVFEFHDREGETWSIELEAHNGSQMKLDNGGAILTIDGVRSVGDDAASEYDNVYRKFAELIDARETDCDLVPLKIIEDIFNKAQTRAMPDDRLSI